MFLVSGFIKYSLTSTAPQNFVPSNLCLILLLSPILNVSIVSYSCSLNKLNALGACQKLGPIESAQKLSSGFI